MGKPVSSNVQRVETTAINTLVCKEVFDKFKDELKYRGYPMNIVLEALMLQYANRRIYLHEDDIMKFKTNVHVFEQDILNTTFNKEIYLKFKAMCQANGFYVKHVITALMEDFVNNKYILEFVHPSDIKEIK